MHIYSKSSVKFAMFEVTNLKFIFNNFHNSERLIHETVRNSVSGAALSNV
jgi:hypothetical protein